MTQWTPANIETLRSMYLSTPRPTVEAIAAHFGTTVSGVQTAASRYGISVLRVAETEVKNPNLKKPITATVVKRACMSCKTAFVSEGRHNRLCPRCRSLYRSAA